MKTFACACGNRLFFDNTLCLVCGRESGFLPDRLVLSALEQAPAGGELATADGGRPDYRALAAGACYRKCRNYAEAQVCNWMVPADEPHAYCVACGLNHTIPDLSQSQNWVLWRRVEAAKRRLVYTLLQLGLPVIGKQQDPERGLWFEFLKDPPQGEAAEQDAHVMTGHDEGVITLNVAEADPSAREAMREQVNERYRTLLGHFRHEVGHYYWNLLIRDGPPGRLEDFRALFGDERRDYGEALKAHYARGAAPDWQHAYISVYAASHPWEDWAETWAHFLHMLDTLETAHDFGFAVEGRRVLARDEGGPAFESLLDDWQRLSVALNELNRSMGLSDAYPFAPSPVALEKLRFVRRVIAEARGAGSAGNGLTPPPPSRSAAAA